MPWLAYQRVPHAPLAFGAIGLATLPQTIAVDDGAQCELPGDSKLWPLLALSCFEPAGSAYPRHRAAIRFLSSRLTS